MKVAKHISFFLDNLGIQSIDCSNVLAGNPGIGGTEWLILTIATLLNRRENGLTVTLFTTEQGILPEDLNNEVVTNLDEAMTMASKQGISDIIVKHLAQNVIDDSFQSIPKGLAVTIWSHIFVSYWELDYYAEKDGIKNIIFVGKETADLYRDHKAFKKINYIYNCVNVDDFCSIASKKPFNNRSHVVTYMGSLVPFKGFHLLAKAWPEIVKAVPDAELYVIGNGKLYNKDAHLGQFGLAASDYEELFMKPLTMSDGKILSSVHFMGRMGTEKREILLKTKVGVPNPSGITETFCLCAVEMQAAGAVVTTINYPGFLDTVKNGHLYKKRKQLAESVINLLQATNDKFDESLAYFKENFSYDAVAERWEGLMLGELKKEDKLTNRQYRLKWLKEMRRRFSKFLPVIYKLPITERILLFVERKLYGRITYLDS